MRSVGEHTKTGIRMGLGVFITCSICYGIVFPVLGHFLDPIYEQNRPFGLLLSQAELQICTIPCFIVCKECCSFRAILYTAQSRMSRKQCLWICSKPGLESEHQERAVSNVDLTVGIPDPALTPVEHCND